MMTSKEIINAILDGKHADRAGYWAGELVEESKPIYFDFFKVKNTDELSCAFGNDLDIISTDWIASPCPQRPNFSFYGEMTKKSLNHPGVFADCESVAEIEAFDWPDPDLYDFDLVVKESQKEHFADKAVFGGMRSMFFHDMCNFFGMDNYFIKMYTNPDVIEATTERIIDFYLKTNRKCFELMGSKLDAFFTPNDFGSQESLLISPECFKKYILPGLKKLIDLAKSYNLKVVLHSCGSIADVIPMIIDAGIDALHPLQAKAKGMDAQKLAREYKNDIAFIGGVDTQELLPFGTPEQVKDEVRRLKRIFGERFIISPSHEAILPIVKPENIIAMREAAME